MNHPTAVPRWLLTFVIGLVSLTTLAVSAWAVDLPYLGWSPGPVTEAVDAIAVEDELTVYPPDGELLVLTVLQNPTLNVWELAVAALDPTVDIYRREAVYREGETNEEYRARQLDLMDQTVQSALVVAFDRLGFEAPVRYRIESVLEDFPANNVLEPGDVVLDVDGRQMDTLDAIREKLADRRPGDRIALVIERDGEVSEVEVELGETTDEETGEARTVVGITIGPFLDAAVSFNTNNTGGPSAGLMFTLALIDLLSDGDLTKGHVVAGTGTIDPEAGAVGGIGGIRQKVVAAEAFGADYMLVPESNYEEALTAERGDLELVPVATIDEALAFLDSLDPA